MSLVVSCDAVVLRWFIFWRDRDVCGRQQAVPADDETDRRYFLKLLGWTVLGRDEHYCPEHRPIERDPDFSVSVAEPAV